MATIRSPFLSKLLFIFFRRGEHGFVFPDLLGDQRIEFLVHGRQQFFVVLGMGRIGQVVHFLGIQQQVVEGDVVVGQKLLDRCRQVVVAQPEVADQLVSAVEDAAKHLALFKVRHANLVDEAFELIHAAMKLLPGLVGGDVKHLGRVAAKPFRVDGGDHIVGHQAPLTGCGTAAARPDGGGIFHHAREVMAFQERVALPPLGFRQAGKRQDRGHQIEMGTHRIRPVSRRGGADRRSPTAR